MTGIVNITCPWCGGRVDGLRLLDHAQKISCPYCRTELHVPHVGDSPAPSWGYRELRDDEIYVDVNDAGILQKKPHPFSIVLAGMIATFTVFALVHCQADFDHQSDIRAQCEASCKEQCVDAGKPYSEPYYDDKTRSMLQDSDRLICQIDCSRTNDCNRTRY